MKKNILNRLLILLTASTILQACDSGDIYPEENKGHEDGIDVTANFKFANIETFPENYKIIFGSFKDGSSSAISSKVITKPSSGDEVSVSLGYVPEDATYVALYLVQEHSNTQIYPFYKYVIESPLKEDIELPMQNIDLAVYGRIQHQVFSQCLQCHGGSGFAAGGLYLTENQSYTHLVNITAKNNADKKLVSPNNPSNSFLMDILEGEALQSRHSSLSSLKDDDITLVQEWIKDGAKSE